MKVDHILELIKKNFEIIIKGVIPIVVAVIGLFAVKKYITKRMPVRGNNNCIADGDITKVSNTITDNRDIKNNGTFVQGNNNQITTFHPDQQMIKSFAEAFARMLYPLAEKAVEKLRINSSQFLMILNPSLAKLSPEEIEKFSEADVLLALQDAIKSAARHRDQQVHEILGRLISDRVKKPKQKIAELAINEAIIITSKLDANLIKILAFSFLISRTKYLRLQDEEELIKNLRKTADVFNELDVSQAKFEYLEAISCGKIIQFSDNKLAVFIKQSYPHLFLKKVSVQQINELALPKNIEEASFQKSEDNTFKLNPHVGIYLFEEVSIDFNGQLFSINDNLIREKLKNFYRVNQLTIEELCNFITIRFPEFEKLIEQWNKGFGGFSLTAVGIAVGRAYLEQENIGNYDINIWIN